MTAPRVLVTPRSMTAGGSAPLALLTERGYDLVLGPAGRQPTADELRAALPGCVGWVAGVEPVTRDVLAAADALRVISRNGVGTDAIDHAAAAELGIEVLAARGANARGVAELTVALLLCGFRQLLPAAAALRRGEWERAQGRELSGRTLGVVGCGAIGRQVLALAGGLGLRTVASDPLVAQADLPPGTRLVDLDELLAGSGAVTLHAPAQPGGPLLDRRRLGLLAPGTVLVNTARASLVDGAAVLAALDDGRLAAYAVDAFDVEPPPLDALLRHPRVTATPHLGAATQESAARAAEAAVRNLLAALEREGNT